MALSAALAWLAHRYEGERSRREFIALGLAAKESVEQHLTESLLFLDWTGAVHDSSDFVRRDEFELYAKAVLDDVPGVRALALARRVPPAERARFAERLTGELGRPVRLGGTASGDALAVDYHTPRGSEPNEIGVDLLADEERAECLARALELGLPQLRTLAPTAGAADGGEFEALLPLYPKDARRGTAAERRASWNGALFARFSAQEVVDAALAHLPRSLFHGEVLDPAHASARVSVFGLDRRDGLADALEYDLRAGELDWRLRCAPTPEFQRLVRGELTLAVLAAALGLCGLLTWYVRDMEKRRMALSKLNAELFTEVAERHTVERELRETQRALSTLVANLPGVAFRCANDKHWTMEFISDGCIPMFGATPAEFLSGKVQLGEHLIHPEDRQYVWNAVQLAVDANKPFQLVYRVRSASGDEKWVWEQGRGVYSRAGELLAIEGLISDITEQRRAQDQLRREKLFIDATIESLPGTFYVFDEQGHFVRWNRNVERITGYNPDELARMSPLAFFEPHEHERIARAVTQVFEEGRTRIEAPMLTKSGALIPFVFTGARFEHQGARFLVGMGLDLTERNRALSEEARLRSQILQTQKLETIGVMAGSVAHDFHNLLTVVLGNTGLALRSLPPGAAAHEFLQEAQGASRSATQLSRQLLELARPSSTEPRALELTRFVRARRALLEASISRRLRLEFALADGLPAVLASPAQLQQLLLNLLLNAAEACRESGGRVQLVTSLCDVSLDRPEPAARRGEPRQGSFVVLEVRDDGCGMQADTLERLGEPFFTTKVAGRGLGLAAVLAALRELGGWLEVDSTPGKGSRFAAFLPARGDLIPPVADPELQP